MANRSATKDVSDNIIAAAVLGSFWGEKTQRLVEAHASDHTKVTVNKGGYYIPLLIGDAFFLIDTATHVSSVDDIDTGAVEAGKDYFVYACNSSGTLVFKTSLAATYPAGFAAYALPTIRQAVSPDGMKSASTAHSGMRVSISARYFSAPSPTASVRFPRAGSQSRSIS